MADDSVKGSGKKVTEQRALATFSALELAGVAEVKVVIGSPQKVSISTDDNIMPLIRTEVVKDRLIISNTRSFSTQIGVLVTITVARLEECSVAGAGEVFVKGLADKRFKALVSGSGDLTAEGVVDTVEVTASGSSSVHLAGLRSKTGSASASGSSEIEINASETLKARASGSSEIRYRGNPKLDQAASGAADIEQM